MLKRLKNLYTEYKYGYEIDPADATILGFAHFLLADHIRRLVCRYRGHKWIDESYANTETGCINIYCERCGETYHETLY